MDGLGQLLEGQAKYDKALTWYEKAFAGFVGKGEEKNTATTYGDNKLLLTKYIFFVFIKLVEKDVKHSHHEHASSCRRRFQLTY